MLERDRLALLKAGEDDEAAPRTKKRNVAQIAAEKLGRVGENLRERVAAGQLMERGGSVCLNINRQ